MGITPSANALRVGKNNHHQRASRGSLFRLESLEPRLLLSADPLLGGILQDALLNSPQDSSTQVQQAVVDGILQDNSTYWQKDAAIVATTVAAPASSAIDVSDVSSLEPLNPVNTVSNAPGANIDIVAADLQLVSALQSSGGDLTITPTDSHGSIVLGSDVDQSGRGGSAMFISNSEIALMQDGFSQIVIGGADGSYSVQIGDSSRSSNEAVTFTDNLVINAPLLGGEVYIYDNLQTTGDSSITINGSGHTTHIVDSDIHSGSSLTFDDSVIVSGTALVTAATYIQVGASSSHSLNGDGNTSNRDALTLQAGTDVTVLGRVGDTDPLEAFYIAKSGTDGIYGTDDDLAGAVNVTFDSEVKVDGDFIINATGVVSFKKSVVVTNGNLKISGATLIIFEDSVSVVGGGNIFLEGNEVDFKTGTTSVNGTGSLTIRPSNKATNIEIADPAYPTDCLNLTLPEVKSFASTFSSVIIGWQDAGTTHTTVGTTGSVRIGTDNGELGNPTFTNKTAVFGSSIQVKDYGVSGYTLLSYKDLTLDALGAIDIENQIKIFDGTIYSDLTLFSLNGKISQLDNNVDVLIKEPIYANKLIVTAGNGVNLGWVDVNTVDMQNTGSSGNMFVNIIAAGGDVSVSGMAQTSATGSGGIVLTTENGKITVAATGSGVSTAGTGNILLSSNETAEGTTTNADITVSKNITGGGNISIISKDNIIQTATTGDISSTKTGTIDLKADDAITMGDGALTQSNNGNIRYEATAGNITLGELNAGTGIAGIFATNGSIIDLGTDTSSVDITARDLILTAKVAIGSSTNPLEIAVVNLSTKSINGATYMAESDSVTVTALTLAVQRVLGVPNPSLPGISDATTGTAIATPNDVQEDLVSGSDLVLVTADGSITVNGGTVAATGIAAVGSILLSAGKTSANADITLNASVISSSGNISIISKDSIIQTAAGDISTVTASKTIDLKADVGITMSDGALTQTVNGNIRYEATAGDITLGELNAGTAWAAVIATAGSILDQADTNAVDITANNLILSAGTAIGASTNHLETTVVNISAGSGSGSTFITESDSVSVTNLSVTVNRFNGDGTTTTTTAAIQEDLVSGADLVLVTTNGFITVGGGATAAVGINAVGNILLSSGETGTDSSTITDVTLNASVVSSGGNISLYSKDSITQVAAGDISAAGTGKTVDLRADDAIVMVDGALTQTTNGNIRYAATSGNITLGELNAGSGWAAIIATAGSILDLGSDTSIVDVIADNLILTAGTAIGQNSDHLETTVVNLSAKSTSGGTFVTESDGVTVTNLSVTVNRVDGTGAPTATTADVQEDLLSSAGLVLIATTGSITLSGGSETTATGVNAAGNILVNAVAGAIDVQAGVISTTGNISIIAGTTLSQSANVSDITSGGGTIDIKAGTGISMVDGAVTGSGGGTVRYESVTGDITLGEIAAGIGKVAIIATVGSILDLAVDTSTVDVTANDLLLTAGTAIAAPDNHLETTVVNLTAKASGGSLFIAETNGVIVKDVSVTVNRVKSDGTVTASTVTTGQEDLTTAGGNGTIVLNSATGDIIITDSSDSNVLGISANGSGNIRLNAAGGSIDIQSGITSGSGNITILGGVNVSQSLAAADIATVGGTVDLEATTGTISMIDGADTTSGAGNIRYNAASTISIGALSTTANISLSGTSITDSGTAETDITAATLMVRATNGFGASDNHLETSVGTLAANVGTGGLFVTESNGVVIDTVAAITVKQVGIDGSNGSDVTDGALGNIVSSGTVVLETISGDITVETISAGSNSVTLTAAGDILDLDSAGDTEVDIIASGLTMTAGSGIGTGVNHLETTVSTLSASAGAGGIFITESDGLTISGLTTSAGGHIVLVNSSGDLAVSGAITAAGTGNILLQSAGAITQNFSIDCGSGNISISTGSSFTQKANISTTNSGTIEILSGSSIAMDNGVLTSSTGNIRYNAATTISIGALSTTANISLSGTSITDSGAAETDISAATLMVRASSGFGAGGNHIETTIGTLAATVGAGGLFVTESNGVTVDAVAAVVVKRVGDDGSNGVDVTDGALSDLTASAGGGVVLVSITGDIALKDGDTNIKTVDVAGIGNIFINAVAGSIDVRTGVISSAGNISIIAGTTLSQSANVSDITSGGGTIDIKAGTGISMADGAVTGSGGGTVRYESVTGDIALGEIAAGAGKVAIIATAGSILDLAVDTSTVDVTANDLLLTAGTAIATPDNHLETTVVNLTAKASGGSLFIAETDGVTVKNVSVTVNRVKTDGTVTASTVTTGQEDLTTAGGNGNIVLQTTIGDIIVTDSTDANAFGISANGSGNIRLNAAGGSIDIQSGITSGSGNITVLGGVNVSQSLAAADIATSGGTVDLEATTGAISMINGAVTTSANGNIRYNAVGTITLGSLNANAGSVSILSGASILDVTGTDSDIDVIAASLRVSAAGGFGTGVNHLETTIGTFAASVGAGGLFVTESDGIIVDTVAAVTVKQVGGDGVNGIDVTDGAISDLVSLGAVVLQTTNGSITTAATNGAISAVGNILLSAGETSVATVAGIAIGATITTTAASNSSISINAMDFITQTAAGDISADGSGTIDMYVSMGTSSGAITMSDGASLTSGSGNIYCSATTSLSIGTIFTGGSVSLKSPAITDSANDTANPDIDVMAANLLIAAFGSGVGTGINHIETTVTRLAADLGATGSFFVTETNAIVIDTVADVVANRVKSDGTIAGSTVTGYSLSDITTDAGHVVLDAADIIVNGGGNTTGISTSGSGNVLLNARSGNIALNAIVDGGTGNVSLNASGNITLANKPNILKTDGSTTYATIDVTSGGSVIMADGSTVLSNGGDIRIEAVNDISVSYVYTTTTGLVGNVALISTSGSIVDIDNGTGQDVKAAGLFMSAAQGIASGANHLETTVVNLSAAAGAGGLFISETDDVTAGAVVVNINRVDLAAGAAVVSNTQGNLTSGADLVLLSAGSITAAAIGGAISAGGNITLTASSGDITVETISAGSGNVTLIATTGDILDLDSAGDNGAVADITATSLIMTAGSGIGSGVNHLETTVATLSASAGADGLFITESDGLTISGLTTTAGGHLVLVNTSGDLIINSAITAAGAGNLLLQSAGAITQNFSIDGGSGNISISTGSSFNQKANISTTGSGTIEILSGSSIAMDNGVLTSSAGNIRYNAATTISVSALSTTENISLSGTSITDSGTAETDITAATLMVRASTGFGASGNHLETAVGVLAANVGSGGLFVTESDEVVVGSVAVTVKRVGIDGSNGGDVTDGALSDLVSLGAVVLQTISGDITTSVIGGTINVGGNLLLKADGTSSDITLGAALTNSATGGNVSLVATQDILQNANITTNSADKTIDLLAGRNISMAGGTVSTTNNQAIRYEAGGIIVLGSLNAGSADTAGVSLVSGGPISDSGDTHVDIVTNKLIIVAGTGVGARDNYIETTASTLSATTGSGGLFIAESSDIVLGTVAAITVNRVESDGSSTATVTAPAHSDLTSAGDIVVQTANGSITTLAGGGNVTASGIIQLHAGGSVSDINQNSAFAAHDIVASAGNNIKMSAVATTAVATAGSVLYDAGKNINVATITAASGVVTLKAGANGEITDSGNDAVINVTATDLNMIGHGVANTSAKPDDQTIAAMRNQAIETKVDRVFVASYSVAAAKLDYLIGQNISGILRENNGWSLQLVNQGFMVSTKTFSSSTAAPSSVLTAATAKSVDTWQYTRNLDFQFLEHLSAKSEVVRSQPQSSLRIVPADLNLFKQTGRVVEIESQKTYPVVAANASADLYSHTTLNGDVLAIGGCGIIPAFGTAAFDQMIAKSTHEPLLFEYWIEEMMF